MKLLQPVGSGAAARKYDLLTALGTSALSREPGEQRLMLRLMVAITARYNWASDTLAVAQTDLARMWSVDERTVKRMMAEFRARGWLTLKRKAARGRVAEYGLGIAALFDATRDDWAKVGTDFETRLAPNDGPTSPSPTVVPFPVAPIESSQGRIWPRVVDRIAATDPATARAWLQGVSEAGLQDGVLSLSVPGRYQANYLRTHLVARLLEVARQIEPRVSALTLIAARE